MEKVLKRIRTERMKIICINYFTVLLAWSIVMLALWGLYNAFTNSTKDNRVPITNAQIHQYDKYLVIDYSVDETDYQQISVVPDEKKEYSKSDLSISYYKDYPGSIYVEYPNESDNDFIIITYSIIVLLVVVFIFFIIIYFIIYNKYIRIAKNGMLIETEVIQHSNNKYIVKWINPEDKKSYYYIFNTKIVKSKWEEKVEKMYLAINKSNYKEFYVVGKEMI